MHLCFLNKYLFLIIILGLGLNKLNFDRTMEMSWEFDKISKGYHVLCQISIVTELLKLNQFFEITKFFLYISSSTMSISNLWSKYLGSKQNNKLNSLELQGINQT